MQETNPLEKWALGSAPLHHSLADAARISGRSVNDIVQLAIQRKVTLLVVLPKGVDVCVVKAFDGVLVVPGFSVRPDYLVPCQHTCLQLLACGVVEECDFDSSYDLHSSGEKLIHKLPNYGTHCRERLLFKTCIGSVITPIKLVTETLQILHADLLRVIGVDKHFSGDQLDIQPISKEADGEVIGAEGEAGIEAGGQSEVEAEFDESKYVDYKKLAEVFGKFIGNEDVSRKYFKQKCSSNLYQNKLYMDARTQPGKPGGDPAKFDVVLVGLALCEGKKTSRLSIRAAIKYHYPDAADRFDACFADSK